MRRLPGSVVSVALVALLLGWAVALRPVALGGTASYIVIRGTSMLPGYETGDLVMTRSAGTYAIDDVVAYRVPAGEIGAGHTVVHRIIGGDGSTGFVMRGDNNPDPDPWHPKTSDIVGRAWLWVPQFGRAIAFLHQPASLGALAASIVIAWMVLRPAGASPSAAARVPGARASRLGGSIG